METCRTAGVSVFMLEQGIDTETSNGMSMLDLTAMMALHLRQSRRDRILRGQAAARSLSIRFGRPPIPTAKIEKAKHLLAMGKGVREVARLAGGIARHPSRESRRPCVQRPPFDIIVYKRSGQAGGDAWPRTNERRGQAYLARRHSLIGVISPCGVFTGEPLRIRVSAAIVTV